MPTPCFYQDERYGEPLDHTRLTVTTTASYVPPQKRKRTALAYYIVVAKWMWKHRDERNCRQKWRRMEREIGGAD